MRMHEDFHCLKPPPVKPVKHEDFKDVSSDKDRPPAVELSGKVDSQGMSRDKDAKCKAVKYGDFQGVSCDKNAEDFHCMKPPPVKPVKHEDFKGVSGEM